MMATAEGKKAAQITQKATKDLLVALQYTPDDRLDWVPMGSAKTPRAIIVECAAGYKWLAAVLRGEEYAAEVWGNAQKGEYPTREVLGEYVRASEAELLSAIESLTAEQLCERRRVFWGEETVGDLLWTGAWHTNYHVGQLNYIQTLWGDTEMHRG